MSSMTFKEWLKTTKWSLTHTVEMKQIAEAAWEAGHSEGYEEGIGDGEAAGWDDGFECGKV